MHSIRKTAHRHAWYDNNDSYNPVRRYPTNTRTRSDLERGNGTITRTGAEMPIVEHTSTESDAVSPAEVGRRNGQQTKGIKKAGTFPEGPHGDRPLSSEMPREEVDPIDEKSKESSNLNGSADTSAPYSNDHTGTSVNTDGTRQRKFHIPFVGKKDEEVERTPTAESKKDKPKHEPIPLGGQLKAIFASWINVLLVFVPVGIALSHVPGMNGTVVFIINFIAIIPLAAMLSFATEELAYYVGETLGGLLNASFGNATELIVSVIALTQQKILIVQTSLIGSMLSNLLLVLGMCFFCGGVNRVEQFFNITVANTAASLLALAIGSLVLPTAFRIFSPDDSGVTPTSRATAVLLLFVYACYLLFQLHTHTTLYNEPSKKALIKQSSGKGKAAVHRALGTVGIGPHPGSAKGHNAERAEGSDGHQNDKDDEDEQVPQLSVIVALIVLACSTALIAVTSDGMVSAIDAISGSVSQEFIGLILIPIVGNAAEHATAVTVAIKDKMDLAIGVAVGSSLQIALFVLPFMVIVGWCGVGKPAVMDLNFDGFQVIVLFIAIILVNYLIQDGKSHWLEGVMLFTVYIIIATAAWYYPADAVPL